MMRYSYLCFLVVAFLNVNLLYAQGSLPPKIEHEERISVDEYPVQALKIVEQIGKYSKKIKYYKEKANLVTYYEAKFKYKGKKYSVESDSIGALIDIENQIKNRAIGKAALIKIKKYLKESTHRFKIEKVQRQFLINGQNAATISRRLENNDFNNYELIVAFKENRKIYRKEMLFSKEGVLLQEREVKRLQYDFLLF